MEQWRATIAPRYLRRRQLHLLASAPTAVRGVKAKARRYTAGPRGEREATGSEFATPITSLQAGWAPDLLGGILPGTKEPMQRPPNSIMVATIGCRSVV